MILYSLCIQKRFRLRCSFPSGPPTVTLVGTSWLQYPRVFTFNLRVFAYCLCTGLAVFHWTDALCYNFGWCPSTLTLGNSRCLIFGPTVLVSRFVFGWTHWCEVTIYKRLQSVLVRGLLLHPGTPLFCNLQYNSFLVSVTATTDYSFVILEFSLDWLVSAISRRTLPMYNPLFVLCVISAAFQDSSYFEKEAKAKASSCSLPVVEVQEGCNPRFPNCSNAWLDLCSAQNPSQQRLAIYPSDSSSFEVSNGDKNLQSVEMCDLQENGSRISGVLSWMWQLVGGSVRFFLPTKAQTAFCQKGSGLGLARLDVLFITDKTEKLLSQSKDERQGKGQGQRERTRKRQREGQEQREGQRSSRCHPISFLLDEPGRTNVITAESFPSYGECPSSPSTASRTCWTRCGVGCCHSQSVSRQQQHPGGDHRSTGHIRFYDRKTSHSRTPQSNGSPWPCPEVSARTGGWEGKTPPPVDDSHERVTPNLAKTAFGLRCKAAAVWRGHLESQVGYRERAQADPNPQCQGGRKATSGAPNPCRRGRVRASTERGGCGRKIPTETTPQSDCQVCFAPRGGRKGHNNPTKWSSCSGNLRSHRSRQSGQCRWKEHFKAFALILASQAGCGYAGFAFEVTEGSAFTCPEYVNGKRLPKHSLRVGLLDVEAYSWSEPTSAACIQKLPRDGFLPVRYDHYAEDVLNPYQAALEASTWHWNVINESNFDQLSTTARRYLESPSKFRGTSHSHCQPHVFDRWCAGSGSGHFPEPLDTPEDDLEVTNAPRHFEWQAPQASMSTLTPFLEYLADGDGGVLQRTTTAHQSQQQIPFKTYGYFGRYNGQRDLQVHTGRISQWMDHIKDLWRDLARPQDITITTVIPQPDASSIHLIVSDIAAEQQVLILIDILKDSTELERSVVECTQPSTGYTTASRAGAQITIDADYHFRLDGVHYYGFDLLPVQRGQFWSAFILQDREALHLQQRSASAVSVPSKAPTEWRTTSGPNEEVQRILLENEDEDIQPPVAHVGPTTFEDQEEWTAIATNIGETPTPNAELLIYGLKETHIGVRRVPVQSFNLVAIEASLIGLWPHFDHLARKVHIVRPQPTQHSLHEVVLILEYYDLWHPVDPRRHPVLHECLQPGLETILRAAHYCAAAVTKEMFPLDRINCPVASEDVQLQVWTRGRPLQPLIETRIHPGDLITIRSSAGSEEIEAWVQNLFPNARTFKHDTLTRTEGAEIAPVTWTFIGQTDPGRPACIDTFAPTWLRLHDPYFVVQSLLEVLTHRNINYRSQVLHDVRLTEPGEITFLYGQPQTNACLIHATFSAKWNESWQERYCYSVPRTFDATDFLNYIGLGTSDSVLLLDGSLIPWNNFEVYSGATLEIEIRNVSDDDEGEHEEAEETAMMQSSPSIASPYSAVTVTIRRLHGILRSLQIPVEQGLYQFLEDNWPFASQRRDDLVALHLVASPPAYVQQASEQLYLEFSADRFDQVQTDDVLVLFSIKYFIPGTSWQQDKERTKVMWCPCKANRDRILIYLRMHWFCQQDTVQCRLHFNEVVWLPEDTMTRHLEPGDHIRLTIQSTKERWCDFEFAESTERQRRVFESSPSNPADEEEWQEQEEGSLSPYTVQEQPRSRSRSRSLLQWHKSTNMTTLDKAKEDNPPVTTCKPNGGITIDFDDYVPYNRQFPNGELLSGRIIPPPRWHDQPIVREAGDIGAVHRDALQHLYVDCRTWFVTHTGPEVLYYRDITLRAQLMVQLLDRCRLLWQDQLTPQDTLRVYMVSPTPPPARNDSPRINVLVECNRPADSELWPILTSFQEITTAGMGDVIVWQPILSPPAFTRLSCRRRPTLVVKLIIFWCRWQPEWEVGSVKTTTTCSPRSLFSDMVGSPTQIHFIASSRTSTTRRWDYSSTGSNESLSLSNLRRLTRGTTGQDQYSRIPSATTEGYHPVTYEPADGEWSWEDPCLWPLVFDSCWSPQSWAQEICNIIGQLPHWHTQWSCSSWLWYPDRGVQRTCDFLALAPSGNQRCLAQGWHEAWNRCCHHKGTFRTNAPLLPYLHGWILWQRQGHRSVELCCGRDWLPNIWVFHPLPMHSHLHGISQRQAGWSALARSYNYQCLHCRTGSIAPRTVVGFIPWTGNGYVPLWCNFGRGSSRWQVGFRPQQPPGNHCESIGTMFGFGTAITPRLLTCQSPYRRYMEWAGRRNRKGNCYRSDCTQWTYIWMALVDHRLCTTPHWKIATLYFDATRRCYPTTGQLDRNALV